MALIQFLRVREIVRTWRRRRTWTRCSSARTTAISGTPISWAPFRLTLPVLSLSLSFSLSVFICANILPFLVLISCECVCRLLLFSLVVSSRDLSVSYYGSDYVNDFVSLSIPCTLNFESPLLLL